MKKIFLVLMIMCIVIITGCDRRAPLVLEEASKNICSYDIDIDYDKATHTAICSQTFLYINLEDTIMNDLYFHIYPRAFEDGVVNKPITELTKANAYTNGVNYGDFDITKLLVDGINTEIKYEGTDEDILVVDTQDIGINKQVTVEMEYNMLLPNINHRYGYGDNAINLGNFYPILCVYENGEWDTSGYHSNGDPFYSEIANYRINLTCDDSLVVANTGYVVNTDSSNGTTTYDMQARAVRDFAIVLSDKFQVLSSTVDDTIIKYYYYDQPSAEEYLQTAIDSVTTFSTLFGEYPYSTLSVVRTNFVHGGMEYPNLVYISDAIDTIADYKNVIIHEIAHQWWYGVVGNDEYSYGWLDEGLTEYSTALFYENNINYDINIDEVITNTTNSYVNFMDIYSSVLGDIDTTMNRALDEYMTEPEYVYMSYVKGMLLFDNIRTLVGNNKFFECLQDYYNKYAFGIADPDCLIGVFEKRCGRDIAKIFDSWIEGRVVLSANK